MSKNENMKEKSSHNASPLSESDLESVSGGFTIIDTCKHVWSEMICNAVWGQCPHLKLTLSEGNCYLASCDKGYFANENYGTNSI